MNHKVRAVKPKARTANGVKSRRSIAIAVDDIEEGWQRLKELWKSRIQRGGANRFVLTGSKGWASWQAVKTGQETC